MRRFVTSISLTASLPRTHLQCVMNGRDETTDVQRLCEIRKHALAHESLYARWRGIGAQHDYGDIARCGGFAQPLQHDLAVDLWQVKIEQDQVRQNRLCTVQAGESVQG